jgi:N-methylhydantoinase B/oxoprolinase/acetone carboxylase alpha subunit
VHPIGGAQAMGDPILRDPVAVKNDLNEGWTTLRVANEIHGVVTTKPNGHFEVDAAATAKKRAEIRKNRVQNAKPFREWWSEERMKVAAQENMDPAVARMWSSSMELSPEYATEFRSFWNLPADFVFEEK